MSIEKEMVRIACKALDDKKAKDIKIIDIHEVSVIADYFVIASASNQNQVQAMVDNADEMLGRAGYEAKQIEVVMPTLLRATFGSLEHVHAGIGDDHVYTSEGTGRLFDEAFQLHPRMLPL